MKQLLILIVFWIGGVCLAKAQKSNYQVQWANGERLQKREGNVIDVFGGDDKGFYTLSSWNPALSGGFYSPANSTNTFKVDYYTHDLKKVNSKEIDLDKGNRRRSFESLFQMKDDRFYLFTSFLNQQKQNVLNVQLMRPKSLQLSSNYKEIHRLSFAGYGKNNSGSYGFNMSPDSSRLLVFYNLPYSKNAKEKFGFKVYDQRMKPIWEKEATLSYTDESFNLEQLRLDNQGSLYLLGKIAPQGLRLGIGNKAEEEYVVLAYLKNGTQQKEYAIQLKDQIITNVQIAIESDLLICAGFYSEKGPGSIKGVFYQAIDILSGKVVHEKVTDFDENVLIHGERNTSKTLKKIKRGKEVLSNYYLNEIIIKPSGGVVLVAEQYDEKSFQATAISGGIGRNYVKYYYNDILLISLDESGEALWTQKIVKDQATINDQGFYSSYFLGLHEDDLFLLFNDHKENIVAEADNITQFTARGGLANLVKINVEGQVEKNALYFQSFKEPMIRPLICRQLSDEIILVGIYGREQRLGKVKLEMQADPQQ